MIEEFISKVSPQWGLNRLKARAETELLGKIGGYQGASTAGVAFENFMTAITDADSSVNYGDRDRLVEVSRDHVRNIPIAKGIINRICDHAVGDKGLSCHPKIDHEFLGMSIEAAREWQKTTAKEWRYFSESFECDYNRTLNFGEQTYLTLQSELEGGDCFTLLLNEQRPGSNYGLKFQLVEGERVSNPNQETNKQNLIYGVEKDKNGTPTKYHFQEAHPGDSISLIKMDWSSRNIFDGKGRRKILHHFQQIRPGQTRGIPLLSPVSEKILSLGTLGRAELTAAVLNSYYTMIFKGDKKDLTRKRTAPTGDTQTPSKKQKLGSGTILEIGKDVEVASFDPKRPNQQYKPFFDAILGEIGSGISVPKSLILMWFDRSYSASRGEVLLAWVYFLYMRTHIALNKCQPSYEAWLDEAVATGRVTAPGYFSDDRIRRAYCGSAYEQWTGPSMPAIDVLKEAKAESVKINETKTKTRQQSTAEIDGKDWNLVVMPQIEEEESRIAKLKPKGKNEDS
jgi:lambda family phage portal protein